MFVVIIVVAASIKTVSDLIRTFDPMSARSVGADGQKQSIEKYSMKSKYLFLCAEFVERWLTKSDFFFNERQRKITEQNTGLTKVPDNPKKFFLKSYMYVLFEVFL